MDAEEWLYLLEPVWLTMFIFGTLAWLYVVAVQITHPQWLLLTLTHYNLPPLNWRVDDVGILSFAIAAFGFFLWRLERGSKRRRHES